MKRYETTFLIAPTLPEDETEKLIEKMSEIIAKKKGKMIGMDKWGKRRLAYPIEKFDEAFYVIFNYESEPDVPVELERRFKQTEAIIRYLTVKELVRVRGRKKEKSPPVEEQKTEKHPEEIEEVKKEPEAAPQETVQEKQNEEGGD